MCSKISPGTALYDGVIDESCTIADIPRGYLQMSFRCFMVLALICVASLANAQTPIAVKQVAAQASDIVNGLVRLPDPESTAVRSRSLMIPVQFRLQNGAWEWEHRILVPAGSGARVAFLPALDGFWDTELQTPMGETDDMIAGMRTSRESLPFGNTDRSFVCVQSPYEMPGEWTARIRSPELVDGYVLIDSGSGVELTTSLRSLQTLVGEPIVLHSSFSDGFRVRSLEAEVVSAAGERFSLDAKEWRDELSFTPVAPGRYSVRVVASGMNDRDEQVTLSTQHLIVVERAALELGDLDTQVDAHGDLVFRFDDDATKRRIILAAEVWGDRNGERVPICWLSRVCGEERSLTLDQRWISMERVDPRTLELRNLRVHDVDSMVPIELIERLEVGPVEIDPAEFTAQPTEDMLRGRWTKMVESPVRPSQNRGVLPGHRLMLVHGYCTDANPFPIGHFSGDLAVFEDFEQSRSHDAFALEMLSQSAPMKSFGVIGHSQGGMGALHLYTFYWSGLDWAKGDRLIQSVGAPYQGTALAGNAAVLGDIFGFGCGENASMTYAGSASWLSTIPSWARADVWYWTTSFDDRPFLYDYCNLITDLLLSDPDDGVIEQSAGQLSGANNMGHTEDWCHTTGMRDPAQCTDSSRNAQMNSRARR